MAESSSFSFRKERAPIFFWLASTTAQAFVSNPSTMRIKLQQLGEALAQDLASRLGIG